ncbi:uncharacterized protein RCC_01539 [Ramularia collo-cygni]|uniref:Biotin-protein ligase N-terminal domain-containing protein n=1 Tax=Ramularia collo-cygni TaxID=112498 RepID=A0A2D3UQT5_9PEZI|nr:uncharacterized protein RCC_01539 [Ramularia collo-cygni]CZT15705.1 uncharacterized protein RCC_01539 [Ramularia collo-cygni]
MAKLWFLILSTFLIFQSHLIHADSSMRRPRALVYRGPAACEGCPESVAALLRSSPQNFKVRYAGPKEAIRITPENLKKFDLYAQPGGGDDVDETFAQVAAYAPAIRDFVANGGRYFGICLGAFFGGPSPGYGLLPEGADAKSEMLQKGAQVTNADDAVIQMDWMWATGPKAGQAIKKRWVYFQDGAVILKFVQGKDAFVLGRYSSNGDVAATLNKFGRGWVGLVGPHPEADQDWFDDEDLRAPDGLSFDIGHDLIEAIMSGGPIHPKEGL